MSHKTMDYFKTHISSLGESIILKKEEHLFQAEDHADFMFYIEEGEIRVYKIDEQGHEMEIVRLHPGDFFGEAIMFTDADYPSYAQAVKDSRILRFTKTAILKAIETTPHIANFFIRLMAQKCVLLTKRMESLGLMTVRQRLIRFLLSKCSGEKACQIELEMKKSELAKILGTISETLSRNLRDLQEEDLIEVKANQIRIKNCPRLQEEISIRS